MKNLCVVKSKNGRYATRKLDWDLEIVQKFLSYGKGLRSMGRVLETNSNRPKRTAWERGN